MEIVRAFVVVPRYSDQLKAIKDRKPPVTASKVPPVTAAAPMIALCFHFAHLLFGDCSSSLDSASLMRAIAEYATMVSIASYRQIINFDQEVIAIMCRDSREQ